MVRMVFAAAFLVIASTVAAGCGSGLSVEDATQRCDQEKTAKGSLFGTETYNECIACYEKCGDSCASVATSPPTYTCPDESTTSSAASTTGG